MKETKICNKCKTEKPISDYYVRKSGKEEGYILPNCKNCISKNSTIWKRKNRKRDNKNQKEWRVKNRERVLELSAISRERNSESHNFLSREWSREHRENNSASKKICSSEHKGEIKRPNSCSECHSEIFQIVAHVFNFSDPLNNFKWLCKPCSSLKRQKERINKK